MTSRSPDLATPERKSAVEGIDYDLLCAGRGAVFSQLVRPFFDLGAEGAGARDEAALPLPLDDEQFYEIFRSFVSQDYRSCLRLLGNFLEKEPHNLAAALMLLMGISRLGAPLGDLLKQPTARWALGDRRFVRQLLIEALDQKDQVLAFEILQQFGFDKGPDGDPLLCLSVSLDVFETDIVDQMLAVLDQKQLCIDPFRSLLFFDEPSFHRYATGQKLRSILADSVFEAPAVISRRKHDRTRIGYVSSDFRSHATSHLMGKLFDFHDRDRFEIMAISTFDSRFGWNYREVTEEGIDPVHVQLRNTAEHFIDLPEDRRLRLEAIRDLTCDILVDLNGFTIGQSQDLFFQRAAPIQLAYLGYPGTTSNPSIDGLIADQFVIPPNERDHFSEKIINLPGFYQINSYRHLPVERVPVRAEANLPDDAVVFSCFCKTQKISKDLFAGWCYILKSVDQSVLWLISENERQIYNMKRFAEAVGVDPKRLIFAPVVSSKEHLARCGLADLMLDTYPYGGHTTATDSTWAGVPCLTLYGRSFQSRVAFSLNTNLGLDLFNCSSFEDYIARAITFGSDRLFLEKTKQDILASRNTHPVFDTELRARELEAVFRSFAP